MPKKKVLLQIFSTTKKYEYDENALQHVAMMIAQKHPDLYVQQVSLILCLDPRIHTLNKKYRGKDKATDVLSFEYHEPDFLGEIYISLQRCKVQSREFGVTFQEELERLFIHGLLHLLGYDHIKKVDRDIMEAEEALYWQQAVRKKITM